jgi:hypothetical protein
MKITVSVSEVLSKDVKERCNKSIPNSRVRIYKATKTDPTYSWLDRDKAPAFRISEITNKAKLKSILTNIDSVGFFGMPNWNPEPDWLHRGIKNPFPYLKVVSSCLDIIWHYHHNVPWDSSYSRYVPKYFATIDDMPNCIFMLD